MELGTWGEWLGGGVTALATVVALYLGVRDEAQRHLRAQARIRLHQLADEMLLEIDRQNEQLAPVDGMVADVNNEAAIFVGAVDSLGRFRKWRANRTLLRIYGERALRYARLRAPAERNFEVYYEPPAGGEERDPKSGLREDIDKRPDLVLDDHTTLRVDGAYVDQASRRRLQSAFETLRRI